MDEQLLQQNEDNLLYRQEYQTRFPDPESGVRFHYWYNNATQRHSHDFFEIFIMVKGKIKHVYNDTQSVLNEYTVCLIKPEEVHQCLQCEKQAATQFNISLSPIVFRSLCAALSDSLYANLCSTNELLTYTLKDNEVSYLFHLLSLLNTAEGTDAKTTIVKAIASNCLLYFQTSLKPQKTFPDWFADFLNKVHLPDYFLQPICQLYALVPYSQPRLNAYFHQYIGCTLIAYVTKLRIHYSCSLLRYSNYSILQVAEMSGYNNLSHFNHTFKRLIGCSPREYRQNH